VRTWCATSIPPCWINYASSRCVFAQAICCTRSDRCNVASTPDLSRQSQLGVANLNRVELSRFINSSRLEPTSSRSQPSYTVRQKNAIGDKLGTLSNFVTGVTDSRLVTSPWYSREFFYFLFFFLPFCVFSTCRVLQMNFWKFVQEKLTEVDLLNLTWFKIDLGQLDLQWLNFLSRDNIRQVSLDRYVETT
jgi:hypothetical protein